MAKTPPFSVCYQYCVGGGGENPGANAVQSDYNQNDSSKLDYILNRPFYEENGEIKHIDEKFIPDSIKYTYEPSKIGEATDVDMGIAFVECSEEIKEGDTILVKGYFEDYTSEDYTITVPYGFDASSEPLLAGAGRLEQVNMASPTVITFTCPVKGEIYKLNKKPISEGVQKLFELIGDVDKAVDEILALQNRYLEGAMLT